MPKLRLLAVAALSLAATFAHIAHAVVPLTGATAIAAGDLHTCALTSSGGVKCWGYNFAGQLGNGSTIDGTAAADVTGLSTGVSAITAGGSHTCALTTSGGVKCWGSNDYGQLGDGTTVAAVAPVDVNGLTAGVAAIAAGAYHTCAVTIGGGVKCWGSGSVIALTPVDVAGLTFGVATIAAGSGFTCALTTGGGVKCWGSNSSGQLGNGTTMTALAPVDVTGLTAGVVAIAAGFNHTCAVTSGGGAKCWGSNSVGQLGIGSSGNGVMIPIDVFGLTGGVAAITAGDFHTCAVTIGGGAKCWGANDFGQIGNGTRTIAVPSPMDVTGLSAGVAAIEAGRVHSCGATTSGGVKCWGGTAGLGNGTTGGEQTAVDVTGLASGVAAIAVGGNHTCALTAGGGMKCWGYNAWGQLGNGTATQALTPIDVAGLATGVASIATGDSHSCALTTSGGVKCWGYNSDGQLGNGTIVPVLTPVDVSGLTAGVAAIAAGGFHSCALTVSGGVKCWGNGYGSTPVDVTGLTSGVAAIAAGHFHTCVLTTSGGMKCWGANFEGQLGNGTTTQAFTPVDVSGLTAGVAVITAGREHTCAVTTGGGAKCWGGNGWGQLGNGTATSALTPVDVTGLAAGMAAVSAGWSHTCGVTTGGGAKCWGGNFGWQLGNGTATNALTPVAVTGLTAGVGAIEAGTNHTCALTSLGGMKCWGSGGNGELGNGAAASYYSTPQVVLVAACADFVDVDPNSGFCRNVQWIKNRSVTLGCTSANQYCPGDSVIRLAMAAFMNRLGTSLTAIVLPRQVASGALDPGASPVVCASADQSPTGFQRRVFLDGVLTATATADVAIAADPVVSLDAGVTWLSVNAQAQRGLVRANSWGNLRSLGSFDVAPGQTWRVGLRVSRGGLPGAATLSDSGCNLRVRIDNRNGELQPF